VEVRLRAALDRERVFLRNVVARLDGSDPARSRETVAAAVRYDGGDAGAAALLAAAGAIARGKRPPRGVTIFFGLGGEAGPKRAAGRPVAMRRNVRVVVETAAVPRGPEALAEAKSIVERLIAAANEPASPAPEKPTKPAPAKPPETPKPEPTLALARQARFAGKLDDALKIAEAAVAKTPGDADLLLERGRIRLAKKDTANALHDADRIEALSKGDGRAFLLRAEVRFAQGDVAAGEQELTRAADVDLPEARVVRAFRLIREGNLKDAEGDVEVAVRVGGESVYGLCARGILPLVRTLRPSPADAEVWLTKTIEKDPLCVYAWFFRAEARLGGSGDPAAAAKDYDRAEALGIDEPMLPFRRGLAHLTARMFSLAIRDFERYMKANPKSRDAATSAYNIACAHALMHNRDRALDWLAKSITIGFTQLDHARRDPDLESIRKDPRFEAILKRRRTD
jgi:tetratricopeptide (TPR) repeat protein